MLGDFSFCVHWGFILVGQSDVLQGSISLQPGHDWFSNLTGSDVRILFQKQRNQKIYNGKLLHVRERLSKRTHAATDLFLPRINCILQEQICSLFLLSFLRILLGEAVYSPSYVKTPPGIFFSPYLPLTIQTFYSPTPQSFMGSAGGSSWGQN